MEAPKFHKSQHSIDEDFQTRNKMFQSKKKENIENLENKLYGPPNRSSS